MNKPRYHAVGVSEDHPEGVRKFTQVEEDAADETVRLEELAAPSKKWRREMQAIDISRETEELIDAYGTEGLSDYTKNLYNLKKAKRAQKPN